MNISSVSRRSVLLGASALALASPALAQSSESERLRALFKRSDEAELRRAPASRLYRGDFSQADKLGKPFSDEFDSQGRHNALKDLAELMRIDRSRLTPDEQVSYDVFKWQRDLDRRSLSGSILRTDQAMAINHFYSAPVQLAELSSGQSAAPYRTVKDYDDGLSRLRQMPAILDRIGRRLKRAVREGQVLPKLIIDNSLVQLDAIVEPGVEGSLFYMPIKAFPEDVPGRDRERLAAAYRRVIGERVLPAYARLAATLRADYLPHARDSVGLLHMKGGPELYRHLVEVNTTTPIDPEEVHQIGLSEVARIHREMEGVMRQVGFSGTLLQFFDHIRTDPKFKPASREALTAAYHAIGERVARELPRLFGHIPKTRLEIRPTPALTERGAARGSYESGTPDGSRPGVFYFNAYDLPSRTTPSMETLYLHEGAPGHHFQIMLAAENEALPAFQRFGGNNAFVEGWGLYSETIGRELGVYTDPYQYFGYLDSELFRAIRLVVDSGIHAKGWGRDQSIDYILANSSRGRTNATSETERYIAIPGQALGYKMGQLKITAARRRAEATLGAKFDIREFHDQVLMTGALPLAVLDAKIDRWIASKG